MIFERIQRHLVWPGLDGLTPLQRSAIEHLDENWTKGTAVLSRMTGLEQPPSLENRLSGADDLDTHLTPAEKDVYASYEHGLTPLSRWWICRYATVEAQGNIGTIDGDPPADHPFTEFRRTDMAGAVAEVPWLLVQGAVIGDQIVPPHNLREVCDVALAIMDDPDGIHVLVPDFPTGGELSGPLAQLYQEGTTNLELRSGLEIGESEIIITSMPWHLAKARVLRNMMRVHDAGQLPGLKDIRDESSTTDPVRVVVELDRTVDATEFANLLWARTDLRRSYHAVLAWDQHQDPTSLRHLVTNWIERREASTEQIRAGLENWRDRGGERRSVLRSADLSAQR